MTNRYLGENIAKSLGNSMSLTLDETEVVAYGLEYFLLNLLGIGLSLLAGYVFGIFTETVIILLCWALLRRFTGGAHCSTIWRCTASSSVIIIGVALAARQLIFLKPLTLWVSILITWTLFATWIWAPVGSRQKPLHDPEKRKKMHRQALILELLLGTLFIYLSGSDNLLLQTLATAGAAGIAAETLMLTPFGFWLTVMFEKFWGSFPKIHHRGGEKL